MAQIYRRGRLVPSHLTMHCGFSWVNNLFGAAANAQVLRLRAP